MEYVKCDFCGGDDTQIVARQTDLLHRTTDEIFSIVRCKQCGLQYTNPRPSREEIGRYYAAGYAFHAPASGIRQRLDRLMNRWANSPLAMISALVPPIARRLAARVKPSVADPVMAFYKGGGTGTFLDIGCGAGLHAHFWGQQSALQTCKQRIEVAGIEVSDAARASLSAAGIRCWAALADVPDSEMFGLIRMNWSMEHVHSPDAYFSFIASHLQRSGRAVIAVPNYDGLIYRLAPDCVELPIHLYHFRPHDLRAYGERHGLSLLSMTTFSYPEMFRAAAEAGLLPATVPGHLGIGTAKEMMRTLRPFDLSGWGNDMVAVFEKSPCSGNSNA